MLLVQYLTSDPALPPGNIDQAPLRVDAAHRLLVNIGAVSGSGITVIQGTSPWMDNITQIGGSNISLGQTTMSASVPVTIANNQSALPVTGTFWQATQPVSGTFWQSTQPVSLTSTTITGTVAVTESGTWNVGSSTATGSAVSANAFYNGLQAKTANPTAASDGNLVGALADKLGKQVVVGSIRDLKVNQITTITASTSETTVLTAVSATFLDVYGCIVTNTSAAVDVVTFKDSTAGTTQFIITVPAGDTRGFMLPESGAIKQTTVNNNWTATSGTSISSLDITMLAVKNT